MMRYVEMTVNKREELQPGDVVKQPSTHVDREYTIIPAERLRGGFPITVRRPVSKETVPEMTTRLLHTSRLDSVGISYKSHTPAMGGELPEIVVSMPSVLAKNKQTEDDVVEVFAGIAVVYCFWEGRPVVEGEVETVVRELVELRKELGINQTELAERLGITQAGVSILERSADPRLSTLRKLSEALGATLRVYVESNTNVKECSDG